MAKLEHGSIDPGWSLSSGGSPLLPDGLPNRTMGSYYARRLAATM